MASAEFKELDKKSKGHLSKSAKESLRPSHQSHVITSLDSISAKKILLLKDIDQKSDIYLWLNKYKSIAKIANSLNCKSLSILDGQS